MFGFIYFPQIQQTYHGYFYGSTGLTGPQGSFLNENPIYVSQAEADFNQVFTICTRSIQTLNNSFPCKIRITGVTSYDFALVACGATLGTLEKSPKIWDIAGALPILYGAGGKFVNLDLKNFFPLSKGVNYGEVAFPCLAVANEDLITTFKPFAQKIQIC